MKKNKPNRYLKGGFRIRPDGTPVASMYNRMSRRQFLQAAGVGAAAVGAAAYGLSGTAMAQEPQEPTPCGDPLVLTLWAGKHTNVGTVTVWNDENDLHVEYDVTGGWCLTETHLWVGETLLDDYTMTKKGTPIPGHFPYSMDHEPCATHYEYVIPLSDFGLTIDDCDDEPPPLYVVPHAAVERPLNDCQENGVLYGIKRSNGEVYGIDVLSGSSWLEFTIPSPPAAGSAAPNGLAYDPYTDRFYYTNYNIGPNPNKLYFWDGAQTEAGTVHGTIACGDIDNGMYYYIPTGTDDLYEVTFNGDGKIATDTKLGDISSGAHNWSFNGDIAVKDGVVYGWGLCGESRHGYEFFKYDIGTSTFWWTKPSYQKSLQLAFGSDGVLYGHRSGDTGGDVGEFYAIDTTNGNVTLVTPTPSPVRLYTDTASGEICEPEYQEETAFGCEGEEPPSSPYEYGTPRWWCYGVYTLQCCEEEVTYPETGEAYIGYEDWPNGDFDYNDFGMYFSATEHYTNNYLTKVVMNFSAEIYDSGMDHLIHIGRPIIGGYSVTVQRPNPRAASPILGKNETPAGGPYTFPDPVNMPDAGPDYVDVILFNTSKYNWPEKQIGEVVIVTIDVNDPSQNPKTTLVPPRQFTNEAASPFYDLAPFMANYDPWEEGTLYGSLYHISDIQPTGKFGSPSIYVPYILVIPYPSWIPPYESTMITGPYGWFDDYYRYGTPTNWYHPSMVTNNSVGPGGLSWGPYI